MTLEEYGSQKAVLQISEEQQKTADNLAKKVREKAEIVEPNITSDLEQLQNNDRNLIGLDHKLKGEASLSRKIISDAMNDRMSLEEAAAGIGDSVRYTMISSDENYNNDVIDCLTSLIDKDYKIRKFKNTWDNDIYKGINVSMYAPDGTVFELQFHTEESFYTKEKLNHLFYEIDRNSFSSIESQALAEDIMRYNTSKIKKPIGVEKLNIVQELLNRKYDPLLVMPDNLNISLSKLSK